MKLRVIIFIIAVSPGTAFASDPTGLYYWFFGSIAFLFSIFIVNKIYRNMEENRSTSNFQPHTHRSENEYITLAVF